MSEAKSNVRHRKFSRSGAVLLTYPPKTGADVVVVLFDVITKTCAASGYTLNGDCIDLFATGDNGEGDNETSFDNCLTDEHWRTSEANLRSTAEAHGTLAVDFQKLINTDKEVSVHAFTAAGHIVRAKCTIMCDGRLGSKGEWCTWP